jgi:phage gp16-like protein
VAVSRRKIALIHVAKAQLGLDDDDYRALLGRVAGVASSRDLRSADFDRVMAELERLGFRSSAAGNDFGRNRHWSMASGRQLAFIRNLWREFTEGHGTDASLDKWLRNHFGVGALRMLDGAKAHKVIAALLAMKERKRDGDDAEGDDAA